MIYEKENAIMNILNRSLIYKDKLQDMKKWINDELALENHPFICGSLMFSIDDNNSTELTYNFKSVEESIENITGIMAIS
jgi:hypothetical protein